MSENIIEVDNISKLYRLGSLGTGSLKQDLKLWWESNVLKKQNPFFQAESKSSNGSPIFENFLWSLKNVSFEVKEGEVWGIIGHNGAGKSTLLKILSRIIRPTEGVVRGRGKISSMLEVGTGFDKELSGRENIYISGYMLGMKKADIRKNFDDIVDFSGIGQFLDTPVKRYSSGMYIRLAFAVAAHLEPDILIVDEVLAVGDAEFQKRSLGKMKEVSSKKGRTILFVSHNMQAINNICSKTIWLQKGVVVSKGETQTVVNNYLSAYQRKLLKQEWAPHDNAPGNSYIKMISVELIPHLSDPMAPIDIRTPLTVRFRFHNYVKKLTLTTGLQLFTMSGECIFEVTTAPLTYHEGIIEGECSIPGNFLNDGSYYFSLVFTRDTSEQLYYFEECLHFDMEDFRENTNWYGKWQGYVRPHFPFKLRQSKSIISLLD
ncbi:MAG TPA: ABC transporter ATP-binding protein [Chitinophagaceae bacterium]|jgi:lipopolysaccharide transport system ATP-binding protein|nr:ABC transporter ATP-binding protein [Chitinophagaceae bacterium]